MSKRAHVLIAVLLVLCATPAAAQRAERPRFHDAWHGEDKVKHLVASAAMTGMAYGGSRVVFDSGQSIPIAIGLAAAAGLLRELHDGRDGRFSYKDLVWDAAGIAAGFLWIREIE